MTQFLTVANSLTDYVSAQDSASVLNTALLLEIETYLAAHFYALRDLQAQSESAGDASATYQVGATGEKGLAATVWGQQAISLDVSGTLRSLAAGKQKVQFNWLGKTDQNQLDWWDRNI